MGRAGTATVVGGLVVVVVVVRMVLVVVVLVLVVVVLVDVDVLVEVVSRCTRTAWSPAAPDSS